MAQHRTVPERTAADGQIRPYSQLCEIFDRDDAEHVFSAVKSNCDYFLTLDRKTILDRVPTNRDALARVCGGLRFVSPSELLAEVERRGPRESFTERLPMDREQLVERYHEALRDGELVPDPNFGYVACPKCRAPSDQFETSQAIDDRNDRAYLNVRCPRCGWSDWTEM